MEIRLLTGSLNPRTCLCGPHSILKIFDLTANIFRWGNSISNSKCPCSLEKLKLAPLRSSFSQAELLGGTCWPVYSIYLKKSDSCPFWYFLPSDNKPNNEVPPGQRWFIYISPLLFYHAINNSIQKQTEAYQSCDKPLIINYFKENT